MTSRQLCFGFDVVKKTNSRDVRIRLSGSNSVQLLFSYCSVIVDFRCQFSYEKKNRDRVFQSILFCISFFWLELHSKYWLVLFCRVQCYFVDNKIVLLLMLRLFFVADVGLLLVSDFEIIFRRLTLALTLALTSILALELLFSSTIQYYYFRLVSNFGIGITTVNIAIIQNDGLENLMITLNA